MCGGCEIGVWILTESVCALCQFSNKNVLSVVGYVERICVLGITLEISSKNRSHVTHQYVTTTNESRPAWLYIWGDVTTFCQRMPQKWSNLMSEKSHFSTATRQIYTVCFLITFVVNERRRKLAKWVVEYSGM